jgi:hypothetical protein
MKVRQCTSGAAASGARFAARASSASAFAFVAERLPRARELAMRRGRLAPVERLRVLVALNRLREQVARHLRPAELERGDRAVVIRYRHSATLRIDGGLDVRRALEGIVCELPLARLEVGLAEPVQHDPRAQVTLAELALVDGDCLLQEVDRLRRVAHRAIERREVVDVARDLLVVGAVVRPIDVDDRLHERLGEVVAPEVVQVDGEVVLRLGDERMREGVDRLADREPAAQIRQHAVHVAEPAARERVHDERVGEAWRGRAEPLLDALHRGARELVGGGVFAAQPVHRALVDAQLDDGECILVPVVAEALDDRIVLLRRDAGLVVLDDGQELRAGEPERVGMPACEQRVRAREPELDGLHGDVALLELAEQLRDLGERGQRRDPLALRRLRQHIQARVCERSGLLELRREEGGASACDEEPAGLRAGIRALLLRGRELSLRRLRVTAVEVRVREHGEERHAGGRLRENRRGHRGRVFADRPAALGDLRCEGRAPRRVEAAARALRERGQRPRLDVHFTGDETQLPAHVAAEPRLIFLRAGSDGPGHGPIDQGGRHPTRDDLGRECRRGAAVPQATDARRRRGTASRAHPVRPRLPPPSPAPTRAPKHRLRRRRSAASRRSAARRPGRPLRGLRFPCGEAYRTSRMDSPYGRVENARFTRVLITVMTERRPVRSVPHTNIRCNG